jgi:beta-phosphoglucomutase
MIKCVLFDLDGVLVDACDWHYESLNRALDNVAGFTISKTDHESTYNGLPTRTKLAMLVDSGHLDETQTSRIWELKQEYTVDVIQEKAGIDVTKVLLHKSLQDRRLQIGCVTNSIRKTAELMLKNTGQLDMLDLLVTNEDVDKPKPSPEGYQKALAHFNLRPEEVLIFEDSEKGMHAAIESGAFVVQVQNATEVLPTFVLSIIDQLEDME